MHSKQLYCIAEDIMIEGFTARQKALMHSGQLQMHSRKFCCIIEKSVLRQKLEKSSFCSRNWRKVPSMAETEDKPILQRLPLNLDSTFAHNLTAAK